VTPAPIRFDAETLVRRRRDLMRRGHVLATLLADVLAGKRPPSVMALLVARPGLRPDEAVRQTLEQVEGRRKLLDAGDDRFGRCDVCAVDLGLPALGEMAWADRCAAHAAV